MPRVLLACAIVVALPLSALADVLIMRDGTRLQGELVSLRNGVIEFEERRGSRGTRTVRVDRQDVLRIELSTEDARDRFSAGGSRPSGLRERQVTVSSTVAWTDTGIDVRAGQTVFLEASGTVRWGRDRRDGPDGEDDSPSNPARPMPNRPAAALIAKVGGASGDPFFVGDEQGGIRVRADGRLYLGINDDFLADNSGTFRVVIYY